MGETIKLDPSAIAASRTEVDISAFISDEGVDWGDAQIEAYKAEAERGALPVDYKIPNRQVVIPLKLVSRGGVSFDTIRRQLQAKASLFQREGGWISRQTSVGTLYADVVNATLRLGGDWMQANRSIDVNAQLSLELVPDWYGAEVTLDDLTETTSPVFAKVLKLSGSDAVIAGDHHGRVRIVADEDDGDTQLGLLWGFRSRFYDSAATAALSYQAEALTPLDQAGTVALTGASGGTVVRNNSIGTNWTPVLSTQMLAGTAHLTHQGTYRVWARAYTTSTDLPKIRLLWDVGDLTYPTENTPVSFPTDSAFYALDLGEVRLDPPAVGPHRWQGHIQARGTATGLNVSIDQLWLQPIDDGAGRLIAASEASSAFTSFLGQDSFTGTTAGNALNGRTATVGGTWATSGDATDFAFSDDLSGENVKRSAGSGTNGRFAILGSSAPTDTQVEALVYHDAGVSALANGSACDIAVIARWVDSSNYLRAGIQLRHFSGVTDTWLSLTKVVAGSVVTIRFKTIGASIPTEDTWLALRLVAYATGRVIFQLLDSTKSSVLATLETSHADLATGGALDNGDVGLFDRNTSTTGTINRYYDDFLAFTAPTPDAAMYANQSAELRTDGMFREDSAGAAYGPVSSVIGSLPRLPPSGLENRKVELFLKGSRGDFDQIPDSGIDDISARVHYRPSWLIAPGS